MNILGFISAILIIFSIITASMLHQHKDSSEIKKSIGGYYAASEMSEEATQKAFFCSLKNKKEEKAPASPSPEKKISPPAAKIEEIDDDEDDEDTKKIYECSTLNILPLLSEGKDANRDTYDIFSQIIKTFYSSLLSENEQIALIDSLIKNASKIIQNKEEELVLEKIVLEDRFQRAWYQMQKGSKFYNFEKKIGYPSIFELINISHSEKKAQKNICLQKASREMLSSLFNEKIAGEILEAKKGLKPIDQKQSSSSKLNENKSHKYITKEDLDLILSKHNFQLKNNLKEHLAFSHNSHKKNPLLIICKDEKTKISIKKKCDLK